MYVQCCHPVDIKDYVERNTVHLLLHESYCSMSFIDVTQIVL